MTQAQDLTSSLRCAAQVTVDSERALSNSIGLLCNAAAALLEPEEQKIKRAYDEGRLETFGTVLHILACNTQQESRRLIVGMRRDMQRKLEQNALDMVG